MHVNVAVEISTFAFLILIFSPPPAIYNLNTTYNLILTNYIKCITQIHSNAFFLVIKLPFSEMPSTTSLR